MWEPSHCLLTTLTTTSEPYSNEKTLVLGSPGARLEEITGPFTSLISASSADDDDELDSGAVLKGRDAVEGDEGRCVYSESAARYVHRPE